MSKDNKMTLVDGLIWILTVLLFALFYIMDKDYRISSVLLGITIVITVLFVIQNSFKLYFKIEAFHVFVFIFALFCFASSLWAIQANLAIEKGITIIELLVCMSFLYSYYVKFDSIEILLKSIMFGGYIVGIYSIYAYGINTILMLIRQGARLDNDYTNINMIGMVCAIAIILTVFYMLNEKMHIYMILCLPDILMVAGSGSRKALVLMILGIILVFLFRYSSKNIVYNLLKVIVIITISYFALETLFQSQLFSGVTSRMESLVNLFTGKGAVDGSAMKRNQMIAIGIDQFLKNPIGGIGIVNPKLINIMNAYLHNNYVELLAGGGIIGFFSYYSIYGYLIFKILKSNLIENKTSQLVLILIVLLLVMDYGAVSYYSKSTYFYLMVFFLHVRNIKHEKLRTNYGY